MKKTIGFITILIHSLMFSQNTLDLKGCGINFSKESDKIIALKASDLSCIAKKSNTETLVYVYEFWCKPCNEKILKIKEIAMSNNVNFIVLTIENEGTKNSKKDEEILSEKYNIANIGILSDAYGTNMRKKYKAFLKEISPRDYTFDLSKIILYNQLGEIIYISKISDGIDELTKYLAQ